MWTNGVLVKVVGFSDVERHALNTVFRLSQERDVCYAPWLPGHAATPVPPVVLADGDCAEAVLVQAQEPAEGQRLIWVGDGAPSHVWRVLERPLNWAELVDDLDAVFAATQSDFGQLDLDITQPAPLDIDIGAFPETGVRRALVVGADQEEGTYLRTRLALAAVPFVDEVVTTERAAECMAQHHYLCGVFNLDDHRIDAWGLMRLFRERYPQALTLAITRLVGPQASWWRRHRMRRDTRRLGVSGVLARPLQPRVISQWLDLL